MRLLEYSRIDECTSKAMRMSFREYNTAPTETSRSHCELVILACVSLVRQMRSAVERFPPVVLSTNRRWR